MSAVRMNIEPFLTFLRVIRDSVHVAPKKAPGFLGYSSSSFVLGRFSDGTSETPADRFLSASFVHPGKPPRSPTDEDEGRRRGRL